MRLKPNIFSTLLLMSAILLSSMSFAFAKVDEGMYTPDQISRLQLAKRGLKIKPSDIYNPNGGGLSDAIVQLSVGCTAEFVSPEGLILTNHHCGFDALVSASTPQLDYVENGYKADSRTDELPAKRYEVSMTQRVEDVTAKITKGTENLTGDALSQAIKRNTEQLEQQEQAKAPKGSTIRIQGLNSGYFYYLYQTMQIKDVRVVYAPPRNIGVFGGDPDNFEWSRHTGDFTFLRAYTAPDGSVAEYSPSNIPFKPKRFLTINIGGIKENDFVFVMGYPGSTTRYRESQSIDFAQNVNFPFLSGYLQARSDALAKVGETNEEKRIKFQSEIANFDNYRKVYKGSSVALKRNDTVAAKRAEEAKFAAWINANPQRRAKYGELLPGLKRISDEYYTTAQRDVVLQRLPNPALTPVFKQVYDAFLAVRQGKKLTQSEKQQKLTEIQTAYKDRESIYEREVLKFFLKMIAELPANQKFAAAETLFNRFEGKERRSAEETFAESIAEKANFDTPEKVLGLYSMSVNDLQKKYPNIVSFMTALAQERELLIARTGRFNSEIDRLRLLYQQGMAEMKGTQPYPDANRTLRFTYGNIKGYKPREAVTYSPFTTLKGIIEKDTGIKPFDAPQKLKDLQRTRDFGRFGVGDSVPVNFLSTTDIIGGNSGSPVLNAYGEQVGLVFDGNYEGLGNDIFYNENYGRTISVDIRYVLFVTEKFGGAGWILKEMNIKGASAARAKSAIAE
ncbi:MAG TPA: S46 family peptidase [Pyrinomonadaceae bacterium]|nr:S46 family peptidase [Pyrinomonadaceae bacterium]